MTSQQFGEKYLQYEENIKKVLKSREIYDEDLLHDTYIALYEYAETKNRVRNFVNTFVDFYMKRYMRRDFESLTQNAGRAATIITAITCHETAQSITTTPASDMAEPNKAMKFSKIRMGRNAASPCAR